MKKVGLILEWAGALATIVLVIVQINFGSVAKENALDSKLALINERMSVLCWQVTSELWALRDAALGRDELSLFIGKRRNNMNGKYPFDCFYKDFGVDQEEYEVWPNIEKSLSKVENWMILVAACITMIGVLIKTFTKDGEKAGVAAG